MSAAPSSLFEIPLSPQPQRFQISLANVVYTLSFNYRDADGGGWFMDIGDQNGVGLVSGIPLITGADLLGPHPDIGIGGKLFVSSDGDPSAVPTFQNLGIVSHLYFVPN